ncbi:hypothetical protein P152DRAFT_451880 [Eremomyces bilateralis CBS 781.70]|uniref:Uncharacterized protein n=1 Tax=Eremomyces bilateralis CBS 781.70 TaxID=1392243 RepID=A0A6G1FVE1_9PEZI|nr:uncharacterized protein P152DRAFT_451880 [Eremomyces bilateralis CBS 781.70]KAF1809690.1 hypothetical protein P152DRAFT_451880 [Eremomyces bilateralis CBS 781.70]
MFMSLLTADAAAQHGHEFSPTRDLSPGANPYFYLPQSLSTLPAAGLRGLSYRNGPRSSNLKPTIRSRSQSVVKTPKTISFADELPLPIEVRIAAQQEGDDDVRNQSPSLSSVETPVQSRASPGNVADASSNNSIKSSRKGGSECRPKQTLNFAHPPPLGSKYQRLHIKPRLLLQLQEIAMSGRPEPAFEVVPSSRLPLRLARKLARLHHHFNTALGPDDMVVFRADGLLAHHDEDNWDAREPLGLIRISSDGYADVCLNDGSIWRASPRNRGRYDFTYIDEHGVPRTVRWISRPVRRNHARSSSPLAGGLPVTEEQKFIFSSIMPDSRRHPIIATMTPTGMDIFSQYKVPGSRARQHDKMPLETERVCADQRSFMERTATPESFPIETDDLLRKLILVSGIWVCFQEEWATGTPFPSASTQTRGRKPTRTFSTPVPANPSAADPQPVESNTVAVSPVLRHDPEHSRPPLCLQLHHRSKTSSIPVSELISPTRASSPRSISLSVPPSNRVASSPFRSTHRHSYMNPTTPISRPVSPTKTTTTTYIASDRPHPLTTPTHHTSSINPFHRLSSVLPHRRHSVSAPNSSTKTPQPALQAISPTSKLEYESPDQSKATVAGVFRPQARAVSMIQGTGEVGRPWEGWQGGETGIPIGNGVSYDEGPGFETDREGEKKKRWGRLRRVMGFGKLRKGKKDE